MATVEFESSLARLHNRHHNISEVLALLPLPPLLNVIFDDFLQEAVKHFAETLHLASEALKIKIPDIREVVSEIELRGHLHRLREQSFKPVLIIKFPVGILPPEDHQAVHVAADIGDSGAEVNGLSASGLLEGGYKEADLGLSDGLELDDFGGAEKVQCAELAHVAPVGAVGAEDQVALLVAHEARGVVERAAGEDEIVGLEGQLGCCRG